MNTYRLTVRPDIRYALAVKRIGEPVLAEDVVVKALAGAVVRELGRTPQGNWIVDVQLDRPSHGDAVEEIVAVLQQLGFSYLEGVATEWASKTVEGLLLGLGGGAITGATQNSGAALIGAFAGALIGSIAGSEMRVIAAQYHVRWNRQTGWVCTQLPSDGAAATAARPALA
jgi:hypothetical protein